MSGQETLKTTDSTITEAAVVVRNMVKRYKGRVVVDDLSLDVREGEILCLVGPNGAGKTTTVEILEGLRRADAGIVRVLGVDPVRDASRLRPRMGVMLQEGGLYPGIRPLEALHLFARFNPPGRDPESLLRLTGLVDAVDTPYRRLSGGQKQRLSLALALLGRPEIVFLDEPTAGMDAEARLATWKVIRSLRDEGITVILTTHYLEEAERLSDRIALMHHGKLAAIGPVADLIHADRSTVSVTTVRPAHLGLLRALPSVEVVEERSRCRYEIVTSDTSAVLDEVTSALRRAEVPISEMLVGTRSLEDVFLDMTGLESGT